MLTQTVCGMHLACIWPVLDASFWVAARCASSNTDSAVTVLGLMAGAAFAHNFGLASSGEGPTANGKIAVIIGIVVVAVIATVNSMRKEEA